MYYLKMNQAQMIKFVMIDASGNEVSGLGGALTIELSKAGGAFAAALGVQGEIGSGWYQYTLTSGETDTIGPLGVKVTGAGARQQNLEYVVQSRVVNCIEFTYTLTEPPEGVGAPIPDVHVSISTNNGGSASNSDIVWTGYTDAFGVLRDADEELPCLDAGTYYFWRQKIGFGFSNPDTEVVS